MSPRTYPSLHLVLRAQEGSHILRVLSTPDGMYTVLVDTWTEFG